MLSEISQSQKDRCCTVPLRQSSLSSQNQRQKIEWWVPRAEGKGIGYRVSPFQGERNSGATEL